MYRTNDPRFRRRLNEARATLENANEAAQGGIYYFGQTYISPCIGAISDAFTTCIDASCPALNLQNRDRIRRQRGRARSEGRAESSFDFYDDWDEDENDGLLGWNSEEFDRLLSGNSGYGTVANTQPSRPRGMSYPKTRRKSQDNDPNVIKEAGFLGRLFGGRTLRYKPSAAGLQEHPGSRRSGRTEGDALLEESEPSENGGTWRRAKRNRSDTTGSRETQNSLSSRGDIFPSDDEDDAVPLDDEFAMVLERRATNSGHDTENSSEKTNTRTKGPRSSTASRASSRRTFSSRSGRSASSNLPSRTSSHTALATYVAADAEDTVSPMSQIHQEGPELEEVAAVTDDDTVPPEVEPTQEDVPTITSPDEPSQLPTPAATDDEEDEQPSASSSTMKHNDS